MGENKRWYTKKDVLRDLATLTGCSEDFQNLDPNAIVVGERPPPRTIVDDYEDELIQRFGTSTALPDDEITGPDLQGITEMLRMVEAHENAAHNEIDTEPITYEEQITVSKLDPNVPEFVPSTEILNKQRATDESNSSKAHNSNTVREDIATLNNMNPEDLKDAVEVLKDKISTNETCVQRKRDRNVAISALLKLYSTKGNESPGSSGGKPVLLSPGYFATSSTSPTNVTPVSSPTVTTPNTPSSSTNKASSSKSTSTYSLRSETEDPKIDPEVKMSIDKVEEWLKKPEKKVPKKSILHTGPIMFQKRRQPSAAPSEVVTNEVPATKPRVSSIKNFVPTKYSEELVKKYEEKMAAEKQNVHINIWTKLENDLKEKDEKVRKAILDKTTDSN